MNIKLPGFIQLLRAPEGPGGGGGTEPAGSTAPSTTTPAPAPADSSGGKAAAPSSTPGAPSTPATPATPAAAETPEPLGDDPFAGFGATDDGDESDTPTTPKEPPAIEQKPPVQAQTPPAEAPKPAEQTPAAPATTQATQTGQQEAVPQLPSPAEPAKIGATLLENIDAFSKHLAQQPEFKLSEADIEAINTDVVTAIPELMARTFVRAQASALSQMDRVVPAMVQRYLKVDNARKESEGKFYGRWPLVDKAQHGAIVDRLAATYRKENPQATLQQMVEELGPVVMMVAKIDASAAPPQKNGAGGPPATPGRRTPPAPPFQPAVGGSASPPAQAAPPDPWGGYGAQADE